MMDGLHPNNVGPEPGGGGTNGPDAPAGVTASGSRSDGERWQGYWIHPETGPARHWMTLDLVRAGGEIRGVGRDDLGSFTFSGEYSETTWTAVKVYDGVAGGIRYHGVVQGNVVGGTWVLGCGAGRFCLWRE